MLPLILVNSLLRDAFFGVEPLVWTQELFGTQWEPVVTGMSLLGDSRLILIVAVTMFWFTSKHRPYQVLAATLTGAAIGSLLKLVVGIPRPSAPELLLYSTTTSPSFPSGHVVLATCFWGILALYGWIPRWVAGSIIALVMFSRVYLGVHYVGDVLAGLVIGLLWLAVFYRWVGPWLAGIEPRRLSTTVAIVMCASFLVLPVTSAFPFGWEIVGALVGAGVGLILQEYRVRFEPGQTNRLWNLLKIPIGLFGIGLFVLIDYLIGPEIMILEVAMYFAAAIWAILIAPMIFKSLGLSQPTGNAPTT
jgi:membrane-associated phospholipid phosphatase